MAIINGNKYALPFDKRAKLMKKTAVYEIYRYKKEKTFLFAVIIGKINIVQPFDTYQKAKAFAERKYGN